MDFLRFGIIYVYFCTYLCACGPSKQACSHYDLSQRAEMAQVSPDGLEKTSLILDPLLNFCVLSLFFGDALLPSQIILHCSNLLLVQRCERGLVI